MSDADPCCRCGHHGCHLASQGLTAGQEVVLPPTFEAPVSDIEHQPDRHRFEARLEGGRGEVAYRMQGEVMTIVHTEVDPSLEGKGIAGQLVQAALDHARGEGLKVNPVCSYADAYMQQHPEAEALRAPRSSQPSS